MSTRSRSIRYLININQGLRPRPQSQYSSYFPTQAIMTLHTNVSRDTSNPIIGGIHHG